MKRRLPISIQDFAGMREEGYVYVDKTERIHELVSGSGRAFFLSRPRRFGKSLLCSTLAALFEGRRELFGEIAGRPVLAIDSLDWEWKKHPVIRLDLNPGNYNEGLKTLQSTLSSCLISAAEKYDVTLCGDDINTRFLFLIKAAYAKTGEKVVVIIDEYDKPLLASIDKPELFDDFRSALKGFYGVLKSSDQYLRFVFFTGVTKFAHVSIFSDLNHLKDITFSPEYADICGITQGELERSFAMEIDDVLLQTGKTHETYLMELRRFYNGYRFTQKELTMYNPFGLLNHFYDHGRFSPYWYETGTPTFLIKLIEKQKMPILDLNKIHVNYSEFIKYDIEGMRAAPLLYQSGYLTIKDYNSELDEFVLDYPNEEVKSAFSRSLMDSYFKSPADDTGALVTKLVRHFILGNLDEALLSIKRFLAKIPYELIRGKENYFQTAMHLIFTMLGLNCRSEVRTASGRIDTLVETKKYVYCFEFKLDKNAEEALKQIDAKEYLLPWTGSGKKLFKAGVNFDSRKNNIGDWKIAEAIVDVTVQ